MVETNKNHTQMQINSILKEGQDSFKLILVVHDEIVFYL